MSKVHMGLGDNNYGAVVTCTAEVRACPNGGIHLLEEVYGKLESEETLAEIDEMAKKSFNGDFKKAEKAWMIANATEITVPRTVNLLRAAYDHNAVDIDGNPVTSTEFFKNIAEVYEIRELPKSMRRRGTNMDKVFRDVILGEEKDVETKEWVSKNIVFIEDNNIEDIKNDTGLNADSIYKLSDKTVNEIRKKDYGNPSRYAVFLPTTEDKKKYFSNRENRIQIERDNYKAKLVSDLSASFDKNPERFIKHDSSTGYSLRPAKPGQFLGEEVKSFNSYYILAEETNPVPIVTGDKKIYEIKTKRVRVQDLNKEEREAIQREKQEVLHRTINAMKQGETVLYGDYKQNKNLYDSVGVWEYSNGSMILRDKRDISKDFDNEQEEKGLKIGTKVFYGQYKSNRGYYDSIGSWVYDKSSKSMILTSCYK